MRRWRSSRNAPRWRGGFPLEFGWDAANLIRMRAFFAIFAATLGSAAAGSWLFQLQDPDPREIAGSGFSVAVIDYSKDGSDGRRHRRGELRALERNGVTGIAYLSIGEAENYRFYWNDDWEERKDSNEFTAIAPSWLGHTNPDWRGNYKVRYWDPDWRERVLAPYLRRITRQGFRGVYLDIVDAFEYWADPSSYGPGGETFRDGDPRGDEAEAARRMIELVWWIADYGRKHSRFHRRFQVFPQNGENILHHDRDGKFLRTISGIGVEDLFYNETRRQSARDTRYRLKYLRRIARANKSVLSVDYVDTGDRQDPRNDLRIADFVSRCEAEGFSPYAARVDRELDRINAIPGVQPAQ